MTFNRLKQAELTIHWCVYLRQPQQINQYLVSSTELVVDRSNSLNWPILIQRTKKKVVAAAAAANKQTAGKNSNTSHRHRYVVILNDKLYRIKYDRRIDSMRKFRWFLCALFCLLSGQNSWSQAIESGHISTYTNHIARNLSFFILNQRDFFHSFVYVLE